MRIVDVKAAARDAAPRDRHRDAYVAALQRSVTLSNVIYAGEVHEQSEVLQYQLSMLNTAADVCKKNGGALHVVLEQVLLPQQQVLDTFMSGSADVAALAEQMEAAGGEGFDMLHYGTLLKFLRNECSAPSVRVFAGFPPRSEARKFMAAPEDAQREVDAAVQRGWLLPEAATLDMSTTECNSAAAPAAPASSSTPGCAVNGSIGHYSFFSWLLEGCPGDGPTSSPPSRWRRIFAAQTIKDLVMASAVVRAWEALPDTSTGKVIVICGTGHCDYGYGVPERVEALLKRKGVANPLPQQLITTDRPWRGTSSSSSADDESADDDDDALRLMLKPQLFPTATVESSSATEDMSSTTTESRYPADYVYLFTPDPEPDAEDDNAHPAAGALVPVR